jgi:hypothetical protein
MEPVAAVKKAKRRDLMDNIKSRVNAGYNVSHLKKNEKDLKDKVKFFEKKDATGELKEYMRPRYELAKELLGRITELRPGQPALMPAPFASSMASSPASLAADSQAASPVAPAMGGPMTISGTAVAPVGASLGAPLGAPFASPFTSSTGFANAAPIVNTFNPVPSKSRRRSKGSLKLRVPPTLSSSPIFNPPPASPAPLPIPTGRYDANGTFHVNAVPRSPFPANVLSTLGNAPSGVFGLLKKGRSKTIKKRLSSPIVNKYLYEATQEFLPLPELYDPYTGRKFTPEEDPMPEIERAYNMLIDIYNKAQRKAATLRKRGSR